MEIDFYKDYSVELDCPPGGIRPNDLIEGVLDGTGLDVQDFSTGTPFFGHQTWILQNHAKMELYTDAKPIIRERVKALYNDGVIRYGSW